METAGLQCCCPDVELVDLVDYSFSEALGNDTQVGEIEMNLASVIVYFLLRLFLLCLVPPLLFC